MLFQLGQQSRIVDANGGHAIRVLERSADPRLADNDLDDLAGAQLLFEFGVGDAANRYAGEQEPTTKTMVAIPTT